jgi:hypothetical protein
MTALQKVDLGTPPTAVDGDTSRDGFSKGNANVDVLNKQATLTSTAALITAAQALTVAHVGTRVNINLAAAGTVNLPAASACAADQVVHLRNLGTTLITLAIATGSGDTIGLTTLAAGESAVFDTDGVHAWRALLRGRANNEPAYMPLSGGVFSAAPTYSTLPVARSAYQNAAAGKVLITGFHAGATFPGSAPVVFAAEVDQTSSWGSSNTFVPPVTGIYRIQANLLISSAPASGTQITFGLAKSADNSVVYNEVFICDGRSFFQVRFELVKQLTAATGYYLQISPTASVTTSVSTTSSRFSIEQVA